MTQTVSVGCKLPWGLICEMGKPGEDGYKRVTLIGSNYNPSAIPSNRQVPGALVASGYGITPGVPKDFIDAWMTKHARLDAVRNGLVFVDTAKNALDMAATFESAKTGFEPLAQIDASKGGPGKSLITAKSDD